MRIRCRILIFVFLFSGKFSLFCQFKNQLEEFRLTGPVKTITANEVTVRDSAGTKKTYSRYSPDLLYRYFVAFNKEGNISSEKLKDTTKPTYVNYYTYDSENRVIKKTLNRDGVISEAFIKYEVNGDTVLVYEHDFTGKKILTTKKILKNNLPVRILDFENDTLSVDYEYTYNQQGKIKSIKMTWDKTESDAYNYEWKKNVKHKCIQKSCRANNKSCSETVFSYDKYGNVSNEIYKGKTTYTMISEYTYDKYGNWTTRKKYFKGKKNGTFFLAERKITYYE